MDPVLFRIDWDTLFQVLGTIIVLSFFVERALAIVVESRAFIGSKLDQSGTKELLSLLLSFAVVSVAKFDALAVIFKLDAVTTPGSLITAAIIAGGSKASIKLFRDVLDIKSGALKEQELKKAAEPAK